MWIRCESFAGVGRLPGSLMQLICTLCQDASRLAELREQRVVADELTGMQPLDRKRPEVARKREYVRHGRRRVLLQKVGAFDRHFPCLGHVVKNSR